ncbi:uncharacterized protein [Malus domestica]|uniref:uncharacterized protein n=1 Tax=Malus domestica TaxID=3750 RepID=UPI003974AAC0
MDFIRQIHPASNKGHMFIIVATDYFTKWVEASTVKTITSTTVKKFIEIKILHRFGMPETIVTDHRPSFISREVEEFARVEDLDAARIEALDRIQEGKRVVARAYNKKVKLKTFKEGELVWKAILPLGAQVRGFGKWSLTWEGHFIINQVLDKGGYYLADMEGGLQRYPINAKFLKKYHPTLWDVKDCCIEEIIKKSFEWL